MNHPSDKPERNSDIGRQKIWLILAMALLGDIVVIGAILFFILRSR